MRQHHQRRVCRDGDRAFSERPYPGDGTEQGRLARAGRAGDQGALIAVDAEAVDRDQRRPIGQIDHELFEADSRLFSDLTRTMPVRLGRWRCCCILEPAETSHHRLPFRQRTVCGDEEMKALPDAAERESPHHTRAGSFGEIAGTQDVRKITAARAQPEVNAVNFFVRRMMPFRSVPPS